MTDLKRFDRILWWGNVRGLSVPDRAEFAAKNGFAALNISPADIMTLLDEGETLTTIRAMAEDQGVAFTYLDPVVAWGPDWMPGPDAADFVPFLEAGAGRELEFALGLGIDRMLTITPFPAGRYAIPDLAAYLDAFARQVGAHGITCVLEAMPMWGLRTLSEVEALRQATPAQNIKLLFDTWHYMRGGRDDALLARIPAGVIDHVQIADGTKATPSGVSLFEDCLNHRTAPGTGELPLDEILSVLRESRHLTSVGPEVFSAAYDKMTAAQIADDLMPPFNAILQRNAGHAAA